MIYRNIQSHEAARGLSAAAELLVMEAMICCRETATKMPKGPFIATQLNSTRRRVELS